MIGKLSQILASFLPLPVTPLFDLHPSKGNGTARPCSVGLPSNLAVPAISKLKNAVLHFVLRGLRVFKATKPKLDVAAMNDAFSSADLVKKMVAILLARESHRSVIPHL
jgi:hypothetical protein